MERDALSKAEKINVERMMRELVRTFKVLLTEGNHPLEDWVLAVSVVQWVLHPAF